MQQYSSIISSLFSSLYVSGSIHLCHLVSCLDESILLLLRCESMMFSRAGCPSQSRKEELRHVTRIRLGLACQCVRHPPPQLQTVDLLRLVGSMVHNHVLLDTHVLVWLERASRLRAWIKVVALHVDHGEHTMFHDPQMTTR